MALFWHGTGPSKNRAKVHLGTMAHCLIFRQKLARFLQGEAELRLESSIGGRKDYLYAIKVIPMGYRKRSKEFIPVG